MALSPGTKLGPYEIVTAIGAGGMGEVYRARDTRLGRDVAIKILPESLSADADRLRRFEHEARAAAALNHPNILTVFDIGVLPGPVRAEPTAAAAAPAGTPFIVSELLAGASLRERLRNGPLPRRKAIDYAIQLARGLAAAHEKGIVHRDLKPDNIFVTDDGRAKILDFGLAKLTEAAPAELTDAPTLPSRTEAGLVLGTLGYMSPEQVRGKPADARSDIFAFGAVLYEMLSGRRAFRGDTAADIMSAILREDPPELTATDHPISPALDRIVRHCLEKEPRQRFQSADDIAFHLSEVSATSDVSAPQTVVTRQPFWSRRRALFAAVAVLVLAITSVAAYWIGASGASVPAEFHQLTFQEGMIDSACFAPDGEIVVFAANWGGNGNEVYSARIDSAAGVRPLGIRADSIASISRTGELALLSNRSFGNPHDPATLYRVPLGGGSPRAVLDDVISADWSADGNRLAVSHVVGSLVRIEYPTGKVLLELGGSADNLHISPDGRHIAFSNHPSIGEDRGTIDIVDLDGHHKILTHEWSSIGSVVWSPSGKEIWFTAAAEGLGRQPHAVTSDGHLRPLFYAPGNVRIAAVRPNGRLLVIDEARRKRLMVSTPEFPTERNLAWLDWPNAATFSPDGKQIIFSEQNGPVGLNYSIFLRNVDGSPAVRLGEGDVARISPDGKWVLVLMPGLPGQLSLIPTGAGEARQLTHGTSNHERANWLPDSKHAIVAASDNGHPLRDYLLDLNGNETPLTPEGTAGTLVTPDGSYVLVRSGNSAELFPVRGGATKRVSGLDPREFPIRFSPDGRWLYAARPIAANEVKVWRIEWATGSRELFKDLKVNEPGVYRVHSFALSLDTRSYAYIYGRIFSTLYYVDGIR